MAEPAGHSIDEQAERNAKARRELYRAAGLALLEMSRVLEGGSEVAAGVDPMGLVLLALGARGRRLLRSAYRLLDVRERAEAAILLRTMHEYVQVESWLQLDPDQHLRLWALEDYRRRAVTIEQSLPLAGLNEEQAAELQASAEEARSKLAEWAGPEAEKEEPQEVCPSCNRPLRKQSRASVPSIEQMAAKTGLSFAYQYAYRLQSQADVHASALVVDYTLERDGDTIRVREEPLFSLHAYDSYAFGAHLLHDLLRPISTQWPALGWEPTLDAIKASLESVRHSDPDAQPSSQEMASDKRRDADGRLQ